MKPLGAFSWMLDAELPDEITRQMGQLRALGVDEVRVGLEVEFIVPEMPKPADMMVDPRFPPEKNKHWEEVREKIRLTDPDAAAQLTNAREVMMYDLLHLNETTRGMLEPQEPKNYYDNKDVLEVRLKPTDPQSAVNNHAAFMATLEELAYTYGLESGFKNERPPGVHLNMSYWKEGKNLLDPFHPEFATTGKLLLEGMLRATHDSHPSIYAAGVPLPEGNINSPHLNDSSLGPSRTDQLALRGSGEEARVQLALVAEPERNHLAMNISNMLAGAVYGLDTSLDAEYKAEHMMKAVPAQRLFVRHDYERPCTLVHVLTASVVKEDGTLIPPTGYLKEAAATHGKWLGVVKPEEESHLRSNPQKTGRLAQQLEHFFSQIKLVDGALVFPEKHPFNAEAVAEFKRHLGAAQAVPTLVIEPGYGNKTTLRQSHDIMGERALRMQESHALATRSEVFNEGMKHCLEIEFGTPNEKAFAANAEREKATVKTIQHPAKEHGSSWVSGCLPLVAGAVIAGGALAGLWSSAFKKSEPEKPYASKVETPPASHEPPHRGGR